MTDINATPEAGSAGGLAERLRASANEYGSEWDSEDSALMREAAAEIDRLRAIARDASTAAVDFQREVLEVRRYCSDVQESGTVNERIVARTVNRMLARPPAAQDKEPT